MSKRLGLWLIPVSFLGILFFWPLANILSRGFQGDWLGHLTDSRNWEIIWFTIWQALVSTLITVVLAIPGAYILFRKRFFGQRFFRTIITVPFMLPSIVVATGFSIFRDASNTIADPIFWIIASHVFLNYSLAVRTIGSFWASLDADIDDAAALAGAGRFRTAWSISLPQLRPALTSAAASTFLYCSASYGVILVLGGGQVHSIETEIATSASTFLDLPKASALALIQTLLSVVAFSISQSGHRAELGIEIGHVGGNVRQVDRRDWFGSLLAFPVFTILIFAPMAMIVYKTFSEGAGFVGNFANLAGRGARDILNVTVFDAVGNSLRNMVISTAIAMFVGVSVSYLLALPTKSRAMAALNRLFDVTFLLPLGISTVVLGFGYLISFGGYPLPLRETWLITPLIQSVMSVPIVVRLVYPALAALDRNHHEAAATAGANRWQTWWFIQLPLIRANVLSALAFSSLVSLGDFGAASLLTYGDQATLPTVLFSLISRPGAQNYGMAMASSTLIIVLTFVVVFSISRENQQEYPRKKSARA